MASTLMMMRAVFATAVAALAVAVPAGAVSIPEKATFSLSHATQSTASKDKARSCQAGHKNKVIVGSRHPQVVACEQPPRANLLTPDSIAKATAAALSVLG
jgi:hypothetical protein